MGRSGCVIAPDRGRVRDVALVLARADEWTYGANIINGGTEGDFSSFLQHLQ
jgi:hypothetical protein